LRITHVTLEKIIELLVTFFTIVIIILRGNRKDK
jgi:hypothetical protein